jgi:hypothetical protein
VVKGKRHQFVPRWMKFYPVDAMAETVVGTELWPVPVGEPGQFLRFRVARKRAERGRLFSDPWRAAGRHALQHQVVGEGVPVGGRPRLIEDLMCRVDVDGHDQFPGWRCPPYSGYSAASSTGAGSRRGSGSGTSHPVAQQRPGCLDTRRP